jgi:hypothetical protein
MMGRAQEVSCPKYKINSSNLQENLSKNLKSVSSAGRVSQMQERNIKLLMITNLGHVNLYHGRIPVFNLPELCGC